MGKLGMGLDKMLSNAGISSQPAETEGAVRIVNSQDIKDDSLIRIPTGALIPSQFQPRRTMDPESLEELASSIRRQGIIQPIAVRKTQDGKFEILAGERRWRAAQKAGLTEVPAVVMKADDRNAMAIAVIENMQRQNLNAIEESEALQRISDQLALTHEQIGEMIGKSRSQVTNLLRLGSLTLPVKKLVMDGQLDMGHARALLSIEDPALQQEAGEHAAKKQMSVRETESYVNKLLQRPAKDEKPHTVKDQNLVEWENRICQTVGCSRVKLMPGNNGSGKLVMSYKDAAELEKLMGFINRQAE